MFLKPWSAGPVAGTFTSWAGHTVYAPDGDDYVRFGVDGQPTYAAPERVSAADLDLLASRVD